MPKIDIARLPVDTGNVYPEEFAQVVAGRQRTRLANAAGLTQFGVNICRLKPAAASSLRHWHAKEDELFYVLEGELVLVEDDGETLLKPGDTVGYKADTPNGHHFVNRSQRDAVFLEIGSRAPAECTTYVDVDLVQERDKQGRRFLRKSGAPYP
jgi:uncharacterized cupin superfamily protein